MKRPIVHYDYGGDADAYEDYYVNQSGYGFSVFTVREPNEVTVLEIFSKICFVQCFLSLKDSLL